MLRSIGPMELLGLLILALLIFGPKIRPPKIPPPRSGPRLPTIGIPGFDPLWSRLPGIRKKLVGWFGQEPPDLH